MSSIVSTPATSAGQTTSDPPTLTWEETLRELDEANAQYIASRREIRQSLLECRNLIAGVLANMKAARDHLLEGVEGVRQ
jgi:hypothetical protein